MFSQAHSPLLPQFRRFMQQKRFHWQLYLLEALVRLAAFRKQQAAVCPDGTNTKHRTCVLDEENINRIVFSTVVRYDPLLHDAIDPFDIATGRPKQAFLRAFDEVRTASAPLKRCMTGKYRELLLSMFVDRSACIVVQYNCPVGSNGVGPRPLYTRS